MCLTVEPTTFVLYIEGAEKVYSQTDTVLQVDYLRRCTIGTMKSLLIIFSVVGFGACQWAAQPGLPQDTPEVAAAKAAHFAAHAQLQPQQAPQQWNQPQAQQWNQPQPQQWTQPQQQWRGPLALPPGFDQNGAPLPVQDTPEVQAERARHFNLYSTGQHITQQAPAQPSWNPAPAQPTWNTAPAQPVQPRWNAPQPTWNAQPVQPTWNAAPQAWNQQPSGLPQDTPEVAAAKAAHFAAHNQLQG